MPPPAQHTTSPAAAPPLSQLLQQAGLAVAAVRAGRSLTEALAACPPALKPGTHALAATTLRRLAAAQAVRSQLVQRPPQPAVDALLLVALALLWPGDEPPPYAEHTLVDQAVEAVRRSQPQAAGFVNAVLRRWLRERAALAQAIATQPEVRHQHPLWWIRRLRADWPAQADALLQRANQPPPMALRVNPRRASRAEALSRLAAAGIEAVPVGDGGPRDPFGGQALVLARPLPVQALPGFAEGWLSVQDLSAQRAAPLLLGGAAGMDATPDATPEATPDATPNTASLPPLPSGARVLDACAAPGGKTAHLLERADLDLLALDSDPGRLARVGETLARLGLPAAGGGRVQLLCADAARPDAWWDGRPFDAILLDAPCTASGIGRRHPDVRWLRRPGDIAALAAQQRALLAALWPLLAPGGRLLYATCSVFRDEGERQIDAFLQRPALRPARRVAGAPGHLLGVPDNPSAPLSGPPAAPDADGDGFFYALLTPV